MIHLNLVRWQSVVDFVVLAAALYIVLRWAQTRALRVALVVLGLHAGAMVASFNFRGARAGTVNCRCRRGT